MMKRVNRIAALLAAAVLALGLSACAGEGGGGESDPLKAAMANLDAAKSMDACMVMEMDRPTVKSWRASPRWTPACLPTPCA